MELDDQRSFFVLQTRWCGEQLPYSYQFLRDLQTLRITMFGHDIPGLTVHWRPVARARRQQRRTRIGRTSMSRSHDSAP